MKLAHICPIFKSGKPSLATNYRPISLLPVVSKVLERVVHQQLVDFFAKSNPAAIPAEQFAYRAHHSCEDALTLAINRWQCSLDRNEYCGLVLADMSKAFDRVQHQILVDELSAVGIRGKALCWFIDYLSCRQQQIVTSEGMSPSAPCTRGVPQGSVLGPLLFTIYIRDAPAVFSSDNQQFADDIAFDKASLSLPSVVSTLNHDLQKLDSYLSRKGLLLNPAKTQFLILRRPGHDVPEDTQLICRGVAIPVCPQARYLGLIIDEHLTFEAQVNQVCDKALRKVATFRHGRRNISRAARRLFYLSIVQSTLEYASSSYVHSLRIHLYDKLVICSHRCMKKVFGLDRMTPTALVLNHASLYSLEQRFNYKLFFLVYRCLNKLCSPLLQAIFTLRCASSHTHVTTRGQVDGSLSLPRVSSRYGRQAISFLAADRWNSLPPGCRQARSPAEFLNHIKLFLGFPVKRPSLLGLPK